MTTSGVPGARISSIRMVLRQWDYFVTLFRRTWRGSVVSSVLLPVLFLLAMGVGLGSYVDDGGTDSLGVDSYLKFVAPGLLAIRVMIMAVGESTYPIWVSFKWEPVYAARIATPMRVVDVLNGLVAYLLVRLVIVSVLMLVVLACFGTLTSFVGAVGAVVAATWLGLAYAMPVFAVSATIDNDTAFALLFRLGIIPMSLFSGAYFPVAQLPEVVEWLAYATPVWHGVEVARMCTAGGFDAVAATGHLGYLTVFVVGGWFLARRQFVKRLGDIS